MCKYRPSKRVLFYNIHCHVHWHVLHVTLHMLQEYGFVHLSAGDLLRAERASGSKDGDLIESHIKEGKIVPVEITVNLLRKVLQ